jgi:hypothetical protein
VDWSIGSATNPTFFPVGSLGDFAGVIRSWVPSQLCWAITGQRFLWGDSCPSQPWRRMSANVTFTCAQVRQRFNTLSLLLMLIIPLCHLQGSLADYDNLRMINVASSTDQCHWNLEFPMFAACPGTDYELCAGDPAQLPPETPLAEPVLTPTETYLDGWSSYRASGWVVGPDVPRRAFVQRVTPNGVVYSRRIAVDELPAGIEASPLATRSAIPVPFPANIQVWASPELHGFHC